MNIILDRTQSLFTTALKLTNLSGECDQHHNLSVIYSSCTNYLVYGVELLMYDNSKTRLQILIEYHLKDEFWRETL